MPPTCPHQAMLTALPCDLLRNSSNPPAKAVEAPSGDDIPEPAYGFDQLVRHLGECPSQVPGKLVTFLLQMVKIGKSTKPAANNARVITQLMLIKTAKATPANMV